MVPPPMPVALAGSPVVEPEEVEEPARDALQVRCNCVPVCISEDTINCR